MVPTFWVYAMKIILYLAGNHELRFATVFLGGFRLDWPLCLMEKQPPATWSTWTLDSWMQLQTKWIEPQNHRPHFPELLPSPQRKRCNMFVTNSSTKKQHVPSHHPSPSSYSRFDLQSWNKQWTCISNWMVTSTNVQKLGKNHRLRKLNQQIQFPLAKCQIVLYGGWGVGSFFVVFPSPSLHHFGPTEDLGNPRAMTRTLLHQLKASGYPSTSSKDSWLEGVVALPRQTTPKASAWHSGRENQRNGRCQWPDLDQCNLNWFGHVWTF